MKLSLLISLIINFVNFLQVQLACRLTLEFPKETVQTII